MEYTIKILMVDGKISLIRLFLCGEEVHDVNIEIEGGEQID